MLNMTLYRGLLFDLDHTLFDYELAQEGALKQLYNFYVEQTEIEYTEFKMHFLSINKPLWEQVYAGKLKTNELKVKRFTLLKEKLNLNWNEHNISEYYINALGDHGGWLPGAENVIQVLLKKGYQIGVLTNGYSLMQNKKRARLKLTSDICPCFIISDEYGFSKPDKRIFEIAVKKMELNAKEILMIGDSLVSDGRGAELAGIDFCWINPEKKKIPMDAPNIKFNIPSVENLHAALEDTALDQIFST